MAAWQAGMMAPPLPTEWHAIHKAKKVANTSIVLASQPANRLHQPLPTADFPQGGRVGSELGSAI